MSEKLANWLSIAGNFGLLIGLVLVAVQIYQSNKLARAEMVSRNFEYSMQHGMTMMGENAAEVWRKAALDPQSLSDDDIARALFMFDFFWNLHNRMAYLEQEGLTDDGWRDALSYHAAHTYGGDQIAASIWKYWMRSANVGRDLGWEDTVEIQLPGDFSGNAGLIEAVRRSLEDAKNDA
jgi:hypothetical protein